MEARIAKLEVAVGYIERDIKEVKQDLRDLSKKVDAHLLILAGLSISSTLGLAALMAKGFHWF